MLRLHIHNAGQQPRFKDKKQVSTSELKVNHWILGKVIIWVRQAVTGFTVRLIIAGERMWWRYASVYRYRGEVLFRIQMHLVVTKYPAPSVMWIWWRKNTTQRTTLLTPWMKLDEVFNKHCCGYSWNKICFTCSNKMKVTMWFILNGKSVHLKTSLSNLSQTYNWYMCVNTL